MTRNAYGSDTYMYGMTQYIPEYKARKSLQRWWNSLPGTGPSLADVFLHCGSDADVGNDSDAAMVEAMIQKRLKLHSENVPSDIIQTLPLEW